MRVGRSFGALLSATLALSACGAPMPMPLAESGPVEVIVADTSFLADLQPGPVLTISRETPMGNAEGKLAKDVAQQFCASRGSRVDPQAFGHFVGGVLLFRGGCA